MPIRAETDFYSEVLPIGGNSIIAPTGQRIRIKKINSWRSDLQGIGLHVLDNVPSELDSLSLTQAVPIVETVVGQYSYEHVAELRIDWVGVKYVTFVYRVAAPKPSNPSNIDSHYYSMKVRGTNGGATITNPVISQGGLPKTIICKEDGDVTVCVDVPIDEEVIFLLKNLTTGTLQEINFFDDDLMERKGSDFGTSEITTNRCLTIPVERLSQDYEYEVQVISNGAEAIDPCSGCLEAILETRIVEVSDEGIRREITLLVPTDGTGTIQDTFGHHDANDVYEIISNVSRMYFIITFESDAGCFYRREMYVTFALSTPTVNFEIYQQNYVHKAKDLYIRGLAPNEDYIFNYAMGDDVGAIAFTSDPYGVYRQSGDFSDLGGNGPFQITSDLVFDGMTCPSSSITPNNFDPIEPVEVNIEYDAGECLGDYAQTFNLCVDPGTIEGGADPEDAMPANSTCETAYVTYVWPWSTGNSFGITDGGTLSTPTTNYSPLVGSDRDVWHKFVNPSASAITVNFNILGHNDAVIGDTPNNPLGGLSISIRTHGSGEDCSGTLNSTSQTLSASTPTNATTPNVVIDATSFVMVRIEATDAASGEYLITANIV